MDPEIKEEVKEEVKEEKSVITKLLIGVMLSVYTVAALMSVAYVISFFFKF